MHLIPNDSLETEMCRVVGADTVQDLFVDIPERLRIRGLHLPEAEPERHLVQRLRRVLDRNRTYDHLSVFLGGGLKPQLVPAAVQAVAHRQELINAYTPYQPEVSQGLLQCLFEYQSLMADITGMEVVNSSMYDGSTALGEAGLMATRCAPKRTRFLVPAHLSWQKRSVLANYTRGVGITLEAYGYDDTTGQADLADLEARLGDDVSGVYLENPNLFGVFETEAARIGAMAHDAGALFVLGVDPTSLGVVAPPGPLGADIVVGEASGFGAGPALGGPLLGLFATREALVRRMPGRIIGATRDADGRRGYVMTLQAREQHIRRAKATSNICTNEAIMAVQAAIHLSLLGRSGLRTMGLQNLEAGARLERTLAEAGLEHRFTGSVYNELVTRGDGGRLGPRLLERGVHAGAPLGRDVPGLSGHLLWGASPVHTKWDYERLAEALSASVEVPA